MALKQMANPKEKSNPGLIVTLKLSVFLVGNSIPSSSWPKHPRDGRNKKIKVNFKNAIIKKLSYLSEVMSLHTLRINLNNNGLLLKL